MYYYEIEYIEDRGSGNRFPIYSPFNKGKDFTSLLTKAQLKLEEGGAGELVIGIPRDNACYDDVAALTGEFVVLRENTEIFRGRCVNIQYDFNMTAELTIEGILAYLYDTYYPPFDFKGTPKDLLEAVIKNHNALVERKKRFTLRTITVKDNNDYIARSSEGYNRTIDILSEKFVGDSLGGYFRAEAAPQDKTGRDGGNYLDYVLTYGTTATQEIELGKNLLDLAQSVEYSDLITAILPLGEKTTTTDSSGNEKSNYVTVKSVNDGSIYIKDEALVEKYGFICECVEWSDVTDPANLKKKAQAYLAQAGVSIETLTVSAVDLSMADETVAAFNLGDLVRVVSEPHGISQTIELTAMDLNLLDPTSDSLTFGATGTSLTSKTSSSNRNIAESVNNMQVIVGRISADYITTENLDAVKASIQDLEAEKLDADTAKITYATITDLEATNASVKKLDTEKLSADDAKITYATIKNLEATNESVAKLDAEKLSAATADLRYVTIDTAKITYATISDLTAANADISILKTDYADINTLLTGNVSAGSSQTIVLNANNTTIANALIKDAMIDSLSFNKITGVDVNTTKLTVHSDNGNSTWSDNTIQISDGTRVRVQIGEDDSGDYNLYLWDESGNLLWNATGVTSDGLNDGIIKDVAVAADANIAGSKLDIDSVVASINGSTATISGSKIKIDAAGQTLDVAFDTMQTDISGLSGQISTNTTNISVAQGQISGLITDTKQISGDVTELSSDYTSLKATVDGIDSTVSKHTTTLDAQAGQIKTVQSDITSLNTSVSGIEASVSSVKSDYSSLDGRVTTNESSIKANADSIALKVSESDLTGNYLVSKINLSSTTAVIAAKHINLVGAVTVSSFADEAKAGLMTDAIVYYALADSSTTAPTSGWSTTAPEWKDGKYMWQKTATVYLDGKTEETVTCISGAKGSTGTKGETGAAGADALTVVVTASNGTVFKNNSGSTILTAHVYKGGVEQSITDAGVCGSLGSIKWYKGGTAVATAKTLTVSAGDVTNSQAYTCQLEE